MLKKLKCIIFDDKKLDIKVEYDGDCYCRCGGTLKIKIGEKEIYNQQYRCKSTGSVSFDENWLETVYEGELIWKDAEHFSKDIQEAVKKELSKYQVCCGGCV
jgi:hypothetical protein